jgi:hypothetical protein
VTGKHVGNFYAILNGRPMSDLTQDPVREGSVTEERCFVLSRCTVRSPKNKQTVSKIYFVKGARYGGQFPTAYEAAVCAILDVESRYDVFVRHVRTVDQVDWSPEQIKQHVYDLKVWNEQARGTLWFAIHRGYNPFTGEEIRRSVTCNYSTFRAAMLGSWSVGQAFSSFDLVLDYCQRSYCGGEEINGGGRSVGPSQVRRYCSGRRPYPLGVNIPKTPKPQLI